MLSLDASRAPDLLNPDEVSTKDALETECKENFAMVCGVIKDQSDREAHSSLLALAESAESERLAIIKGLLYGTLVLDEKASPKCFEHLQHLVVDNYQYLGKLLLDLTENKFHLLCGPARVRLLWLVDEMMRMQISAVNNILQMLMRQISGGDVSKDNMWLAQTLLGHFQRHKSFVISCPGLVSLIIFTFIRLIADHSGFRQFREEEANFIASLMTEKPQEWHFIGRDFIRIFTPVSNLPSFKPIWEALVAECISSDSIANPSSVLMKILAQPTPGKFHQSRLTPTMDTKIMFLMKQVRTGMQRRYLSWFSQKHLKDEIAESLLPDLARFICSYYHPPNSALNSDIVPRWCLLGWCIKASRTPSTATKVCDAIMYDWFFYDARVDSVMSIEPGVLLMLHSIPRYSDITKACLESLVRQATSFNPHVLRVHIRSRVASAFRHLTTLRVVISTQPLIQSVQLPPKLRSSLSELFPRGFSASSSSDSTPNVVPEESSPSPSPSPVTSPKQSTSSQLGRLLPLLPNDPSLKESFTNLYLAVSSSSQSIAESLDTFLTSLQSYMSSSASAGLQDVGAALVDVLESEFAVGAFRQSLYLRKLFETCIMSNQSDNASFQQLLQSMRAANASIGYHLLDHVLQTSESSSTMAFYESIADVESDLSLCKQECTTHVGHLLLQLIHRFPAVVRGQSQEGIVRMIVSSLSPSQMASLCEQIVLGDVVEPLLYNDASSTSSLLLSSLTWSSYEQDRLWQLALADSSRWGSEAVIVVIGEVLSSAKLNPHDHVEFMDGLQSILKVLRPSSALVDLLWKCKSDFEKFRLRIVFDWIQIHVQTLKDLVVESIQKLSSRKLESGAVDGFEATFVTALEVALKRPHTSTDLVGWFVHDQCLLESLSSALANNSAMNARWPTLQKSVQDILQSQPVKPLEDNRPTKRAKTQSSTAPKGQESEEDSDDQDNIDFNGWANFASA